MRPCPQCVMHKKFGYVQLYLEGDLSALRVAELAGVHENTVYHWVDSYRTQGFEGLQDGSRAPRNHPNAYPEAVTDIIRSIRQEALTSEKRYIGPKVIAHRMKKRYNILVSPSGIGKFLHNSGLIPEKHKRRRPKKDRVKKCRIHEPGELIQLDVKYAVKSYAGYWFYEYDAIDYVTGIVSGEIYEIQSNLESILFLQVLKKKMPFIIRGIQTDNGSVFTNYYTGYIKSADPSRPKLHCFDRQCKEMDITHYLIDPGKPAQNGKIERFHRTVEEEFYQQETFKDLNSLRKKFRDYLYYYNNEREHSSIGYLTPVEKLRAFPQYEKIKTIIN